MKQPSLQHLSHDLGMAVHDTWTTARVKSALAMADSAQSLHIHVKTHAGMVSLSGRVMNHRQYERVVDLVHRVPGVLDVDAHELLTHVFIPTGSMQPPNAEESSEYRSPMPPRKDE
ncbi:putative periplasmic or secreted lipoprotein [Pseudomonas asplenii]|uniref:Putative periplasmic or secreted lipoprotein n=1 Tax=Pseudomonas asplenii TaxID=53407 RepID=A0A0M9GCG2_9PSED|nr:BON domain-containing protein [Pseudomonas fuscovaginae]KPA87657.1 putative periplasmic or secreted lipoprotein [Pseudomonas fuscovaginae]